MNPLNEAWKRTEQKLSEVPHIGPEGGWAFDVAFEKFVQEYPDVNERREALIDFIASILAGKDVVGKADGREFHTNNPEEFEAALRDYPFDNRAYLKLFGATLDSILAQAEQRASVVAEETDNTQKNISDVIKSTAIDFMKEYNLDDPSDIAGGYCEDFANEIERKVPGAVGEWEWESDEVPKELEWTHCAIKYKGKYYDAEAPYGVDHWSQLPNWNRGWPDDMFKLFPKHYKEESTRDNTHDRAGILHKMKQHELKPQQDHKAISHMSRDYGKGESAWEDVKKMEERAFSAESIEKSDVEEVALKQLQQMLQNGTIEESDFNYYRSEVFGIIDDLSDENLENIYKSPVEEIEAGKEESRDDIPWYAVYSAFEELVKNLRSVLPYAGAVEVAESYKYSSRGNNMSWNKKFYGDDKGMKLPLWESILQEGGMSDEPKYFESILQVTVYVDETANKESIEALARSLGGSLSIGGDHGEIMEYTFPYEHPAGEYETSYQTFKREVSTMKGVKSVKVDAIEDMSEDDDLQRQALARRGTTWETFENPDDMYDGMGPREGLEGPFKSKFGHIYYYDPREGRYYDPRKDMFIGNDELNDYGINEEAATEDGNAQLAAEVVKLIKSMPSRKDEILKLQKKILLDAGWNKKDAEWFIRDVMYSLMKDDEMDWAAVGDVDIEEK